MEKGKLGSHLTFHQLSLLAISCAVGHLHISYLYLSNKARLAWNWTIVNSLFPKKKKKIHVSLEIETCHRFQRYLAKCAGWLKKFCRMRLFPELSLISYSPTNPHTDHIPKKRGHERIQILMQKNESVKSSRNKCSAKQWNSWGIT